MSKLVNKEQRKKNEEESKGELKKTVHSSRMISTPMKSFLATFETLIVTKLVHSFFFTPGNVCLVQWMLLSTVEAVQYSGGLTSVLWRANISTMEG